VKPVHLSTEVIGGEEQQARGQRRKFHPGQKKHMEFDYLHGRRVARRSSPVQSLSG
jgi:hypothetical protein